jgi:hypothetical protein
MVDEAMSLDEAFSFVLSPWVLAMPAHVSAKSSRAGQWENSWSRLYCAWSCGTMSRNSKRIPRHEKIRAMKANAAHERCVRWQHGPDASLQAWSKAGAR